MAAVIGTVPAGEVWQLNVSVLFEDAEPNTTAEFTAGLTLVGSAEVHSLSESTVEDFMGQVAEAISTTAGRICYVTLSKVTLATDPVFPT